MKFVLISITILVTLSMIKADDSDKEEIKKLKSLAKILIDKAAINKLNELMNSDSERLVNRENLLLKALTSHQSKKLERRKLAQESDMDQRVIACESEELENPSLAC